MLLCSNSLPPDSDVAVLFAKRSATLCQVSLYAYVKTKGVENMLITVTGERETGYNFGSITSWHKRVHEPILAIYNTISFTFLSSHDQPTNQSPCPVPCHHVTFHLWPIQTRGRLHVMDLWIIPLSLLLTFVKISLFNVERIGGFITHTIYSVIFLCSTRVYC